MAQVRRLAPKRSASLNDRRTISIDLPEFAIRALEHRAAVANEGLEDDDEEVTFEHVVEWYLLSPLSVKEVPGLEEAVPGFTNAFAKWLVEATYAPPE
jgi:hypothetical protein